MESTFHTWFLHAYVKSLIVFQVRQASMLGLQECLLLPIMFMPDWKKLLWRWSIVRMVFKSLTQSIISEAQLHEKCPFKTAPYLTRWSRNFRRVSSVLAPRSTMLPTELREGQFSSPRQRGCSGPPRYAEGNFLTASKRFLRGGNIFLRRGLLRGEGHFKHFFFIVGLFQRVENTLGMNALL